MPTIVGVRLRNPAKPVVLDTHDIEIAEGDLVAVSTDRGTELGRVVSGPSDATNQAVDSARTIERVATADDLKRAEELHAKEQEAMKVFRRLVSERGLEMKPVDVEYLFDGGKAVFYFAAEERVDFRDLVRDLAAQLHVRVDMRQIGVRDEARMIGGLGHCGEQLCCERFGGEFQPVSIRMAKEQDLPLNPLKISGLCGRLMCCLRYEYDAYKDFKGRAPKKGAVVDVGDSIGKVVEFNTPRETVTVRLQEGGTLTVPLEDMDCAKGEGCPCRVRAEVVEAIRNAGLTAPISQLAGLGQQASTLVPAAEGAGAGAPATGPAHQAPSGKQEQGQPKPRRRRRRSASGQAGASGTASSSASATERQSAPKPAGEESPLPGRRRRRRRRSGGSAEGEGASPQ